MVNYQLIGTVTHFFTRIQVAVVLLQDEVYIEDWVLFEGPHTELEQQVLSMQINHAPIEKASPGEEVAIRVDGPVREGDQVFLITD